MVEHTGLQLELGSNAVTVCYIGQMTCPVCASVSLKGEICTR